MYIRGVFTVFILISGLVVPVSSQAPWSKMIKKMANSELTYGREIRASQSTLESVVDDDLSVNELPDGQMFVALDPDSPGSGGITGLARTGNQRGGQSGLELGSESDDDGSMHASDLFKKPEIRNLLGDEPRFIYNPRGKSDPMLLPWVRNDAIFKELSGLAAGYIEQDDLRKALEAYNRILEMNDSRYTAEAREKVGMLAEQLNEASLALAVSHQNEGSELVVELPHWVFVNTTGVIDAGGQDNFCLVGEHVLKVGDVIPDYPDIAINSIDGDRVVYILHDNKFTVALKDKL